MLLKGASNLKNGDKTFIISIIIIITCITDLSGLEKMLIPQHTTPISLNKAGFPAFLMYFFIQNRKIPSKKQTNKQKQNKTKQNKKKTEKSQQGVYHFAHFFSRRW